MGCGARRMSLVVIMHVIDQANGQTISIVRNCVVKKVSDHYQLTPWFCDFGTILQKVHCGLCGIDIRHRCNRNRGSING